MPKTGLPLATSLLNFRHRVNARRRRIAGTVRQEDAVGLHREDVFGLRLGGDDGDFAAGARQAAQDVAFDAVVDGDDLIFRRVALAVALAPDPLGFVPGIGLAAGHVLGQVEAEQPRPGVRPGDERRNVELAVRAVRDDAVGHALFADQPRQRPRVEARYADDAAGAQPAVEMFRGAVVRRVGDVGAQHAAAHARRGGEVRRLDVLVIGADIADMGEGEGDDLPGIGGVGQDFLIAGDGGVEADLADRFARRAEAEALDRGAVLQNEEGGGFFHVRHGCGLAAHADSSSELCAALGARRSVAAFVDTFILMLQGRKAPARQRRGAMAPLGRLSIPSNFAETKGWPPARQVAGTAKICE